MSKHTNLDIKDTACLHIVHNLQCPTSCPTTKSTRSTMLCALKKNFPPLPEGQYLQSTKRSAQRFHQLNEGKSNLESEGVRALGALRSLRSKKKLAAEKWQETQLFKQWRGREMDWGLCWQRDSWGRKPRWQCRGCNLTEAGRYRGSWNCGIDDQRAWKKIWSDDDCYKRQSEQDPKFRRWAEWGRWGSRTDKPGPADREWRTWVGDGHNPQNGPAAYGEVSAERDEAWQIDATRMGGRSQPLPSKRQEVQHIWIKGSGSHSTTKGWWCSCTCTNNIWRAYGVFWYCPRNIANTARDLLTRN